MNPHTQKLFSPDRFDLFTQQVRQSYLSDHFTQENSQKKDEVQTPAEKTDSRETLLLIIDKKDLEIQELKKKLKTFFTQLIEMKQKLDSTNYQLDYFKRKITEEIQKSKQLQAEIEITNHKVAEMIQRLNCVKKLKNPIEIQKNQKEWIEVNFNIQKMIEKQRYLCHIDMLCLDYLQKQVTKVAAVIESAFSLKKVRKQKNLTEPVQQKRGQFQY